jgi:predicted nucleotidyltransferase
MMEKLKGQNRIEEFKKIAKCLTTRILASRGVAGIFYTGGLVRGFADKYSDVDITVLLSHKSKKLRAKIRKIGLAEQEISNVDIDLEIHYLADFRRRELDEYSRWDLSHAEIIFDPYGRIRDLIRSKTRVLERFLKRRIVGCGEHLKWYCYNPRAETPTLIETWIDRGDLVSAQYCLNYSLDLLLEALFALNRELLPAPKWRVYYSYGLRWLPSDYRKLLEEALKVRELSTTDLSRRLMAAKKICSEIFIRISDEMGLTPDLIAKKYVQMVLNQTL